MNLGQLIGDLMFRNEPETPAKAEKVRQQQPKRETFSGRVAVALRGGSSMSAAELMSAIGATNAKSFGVQLSNLKMTGFLAIEGERGSYRYRLPKAFT